MTHTMRGDVQHKSRLTRIYICRWSMLLLLFLLWLSPFVVLLL